MHFQYKESDNELNKQKAVSRMRVIPCCFRAHER